MCDEAIYENLQHERGQNARLREVLRLISITEADKYWREDLLRVAISNIKWAAKEALK